MKNSAQMIRDYRKARGITQSHVETKAGIRAKRISKFETGLVKMTADEFLQIIVKGFGITPQIFFDDQLSNNEKMSGELDGKRNDV